MPHEEFVYVCVCVLHVVMHEYKLYFVYSIYTFSIYFTLEHVQVRFHPNIKRKTLDFTLPFVTTCPYCKS